MTSTVTGLPDRYRPLDEVGPEEVTPTGVIRCWRARDRVLNRDVAIRAHTPGGPAARAWIGRALTAGGLATPALAMVYDAAEGSGDAAAPGGAAYVVNEWIEGRTLAERLTEGPMPEREARLVLRRLAEGVAEAHRVGLAVGGIGPDTVVLRPNGLVGLRAVPAASGSMQGDIAALGALLEFCLTGRQAGRPGPDGRPAAPPEIEQPDLAALVRRARSTDAGTGLSSAAAMAALLAQPPRPRQTTHLVREPGESDSGWLRRLRERRDEDDAGHGPRRVGIGGLPPAPAYRTEDDDLSLDAALGSHEDDGYDDDGYDDEAAGSDAVAYGDDADDGGSRATGAARPARRRLVVVGLPLLALVVVVLLAWWFGSNVLSVAGSVDDGSGRSTPPVSSVPQDAPGEPPPGPAPVATIASATLFNPQDPDPENEDDVPLTYDGDPGTAWSTVTYSSSPEFSGLKDGVGIVFDLGGDQELAAVTVTTTTPGATMEIRTGGDTGGDIDGWTVVASGTIDGTTELVLDQPVTTRSLLVWVTSLTPTEGGYSADIAEVALRPTG